MLRVLLGRNFVVRLACATATTNVNATVGLRSRRLDGNFRLVLIPTYVNNYKIRQMSEVKKAQSASREGETIFSKILSGEIPCKFIYEDEKCVAFNDISPQAPVHFLVIPRKVIATLEETDEKDEQLLGHLLLVAHKVAKEMKLDNGFRVVINNGKDGAQSVYHLHLHVMGGRQMSWPPG